MSKEPFSVGIIGGGLAGLSAAVALADKQVRIELFESRPRLGGRAGAFWEPSVGQWVDFGPHVLMGCCDQMLRLCRSTGLDQFFRRYPTVWFLDPQSRCYALRASRLLPAPWHLLPSFLRFAFLSWQDRWKVLRALRKLARQISWPEQQSFGQWLRHQNQSASAIQRFWTPVILSALADRPERVAFHAAQKVFTTGLLASRDAYQLLRPTLPWGQLLDQYLAHWLSSRAVLIHPHCPVRHLHIQGQKVESLVLKDGRKKRFDFYILAVPWRQASQIFARGPITPIVGIQNPNEWEAGGILTWHLWFDRPISRFAQAAVVGKKIQWIFGPPGKFVEGEHMAKKDDIIPPEITKTEASSPLSLQEDFTLSGERNLFFIRSLTGTAPTKEVKTYHYQVVLSGIHALSSEELLEDQQELMKEVGEIFPAAREATLLAVRKVKIPEAVFSSRPGVEERRPSQKTHLQNLALAGDWTATGWPSTMESAVRSGFLAAEVLLDAMGKL